MFWLWLEGSIVHRDKETWQKMDVPSQEAKR